MTAIVKRAVRRFLDELDARCRTNGVGCPSCGATSGKVCTDATGRGTGAHLQRVVRLSTEDLWLAFLAAISL